MNELGRQRDGKSLSRVSRHLQKTFSGTVDVKESVRGPVEGTSLEVVKYGLCVVEGSQKDRRTGAEWNPGRMVIGGSE